MYCVVFMKDGIPDHVAVFPAGDREDKIKQCLEDRDNNFVESPDEKNLFTHRVTKNQTARIVSGKNIRNFCPLD